MKIVSLLVFDIILIVFATVLGIILRDNLVISADRLWGIAPYLLFTAIASVVLLPTFGLNRTIWRFSALPDYVRISCALAAIIVGAVIMAFVFDRLEGVPRSLPLLQFNVALVLLIGLRVFYRLQHTARLHRREKFAPLKVADEPQAEAVLLVGLSRLTETYLQSLKELAPQAIRVVGILGLRDRHVGRLVASHDVIGLPEHVERVLEELQVGGIAVKRIVITQPFASLTEEAREAIAAVEEHGSVKVQYLSEQLGLETLPRLYQTGTGAADQLQARTPAVFEIRRDELEALQRRRYWQVKRVIDIVGSATLLCISGPLLVVIAIMVGVSMGWPVFFKQQRPGLGGRPFRVYKFRTMGKAVGPDGRRLSDAERASRIGLFLRRTRFDELPQLFNILRGDMSFIGPRPLLSCEQDAAFRARLLVRPGLSGWAQVVGGRTISAQDKAALDVWYVQNAGLSLDASIVLRTIPMIFFGDAISERLIDRAWNDLRRAGILKAGRAEFESEHAPIAA